MDTHTECTALPRKESRRRGTLGPGLGLPPRRRRPPRRQQTAQAEGAMLRNGGTSRWQSCPGFAAAAGCSLLSYRQACFCYL